MSETLLLELYERVATLEKEVAALKAARGTQTQSDFIADPASPLIQYSLMEVKGKYRHLAEHLYKSGMRVVELTFDKIEEIIGDKLPPSTREHRAMWANTDTHSISRAWMKVGYRTVDVDMKNGTVKFERRMTT